MDDRGTPRAPVSADDTDEVTRRALADFVALPDVSRAGVALSEGGGRRLRFAASDRDNEPAVDWCHIDAYADVPLTAVVRTGESILAAIDDLEPRYPDLVEQQRDQSVVALAALPLLAAGSPIGGVVLFYERPQPFDDAQYAVLADRAAHLAEVLRQVQAAAPRRETSLADQVVDPGARVADAVVDGDPRSVGEARRFLRRQLDAWDVDDDTLDTAVLCLSELVTNAVIHTGSAAEVRAALDDGVLTVTVRDQGAPGRSHVHVPDEVDDPLRVHGRGLQLVDALAARWGSELDTVGTTVWFVLEPDLSA